MKNVILILLLASLAYTQGCAIGYNSVLFVTKSNIGIDVDSAPPTAEISVSRVEGVAEPTFENGQTLPVMASFKPQSRGLVSGDVAQTFSTGEAAVAMASLYAGPDFCDAPYRQWKDVNEAFDSSVTVSREPNLPGDLTFVKGDVKPVFFGTTTSLGVNVSWSGLAATFPDSAHIGFRRKEMALAPIALEQGDGTQKKLRAPSLLATIDQAVEVKTPTETKLRWLQYFATGKSATALALRQDVRKAMLARLDPKQFAAVLAEPSTRGFAMSVLSNLYNFIEGQAEAGDKAAEQLKDALDKLGELPPSSFERYTWSSGPTLLEKITRDLAGETPTFERAVGYRTQLSISVDALSSVVAAMDEDADFAFQFAEGTNPPTLADNAVKQSVREALSTQARALKEFDSALQESVAVRDAVDYLQELLK